MFGPRVIAQTGWRTDDLSDAIDGPPDIAHSTSSTVTPRIGVHNQYQHAGLATSQTPFQQLLQPAIPLAARPTASAHA